MSAAPNGSDKSMRMRSTSQLVLERTLHLYIVVFLNITCLSTNWFLRLYISIIICTFITNKMSQTMSALLRCNNHTHCFLNKIFNNAIFQYPARFLYTQNALGVDGYVQSRERIDHQFTNMTDKFKTKMNEYVTSNDTKKLIFTEDLKNMVHLAQDSDKDISLIIEMMKKFNSQNKELRFGNFVFGPVVMRMFHYLNKPTEALECFKNPELEGFFDQLMSYQILLDLLYENGKYDDVMKTFEMIKGKQIQGTKYPKNVVTLTMAACYKQNTPESLQYALKLWSELQDVGHVPMRRAHTFCAGLALRQGKPEITLEVLSTSRNQTYMTIRNLRVAALTNIGRVEDVLPILKSVLEMDTSEPMKHTFCKNIVEKAHEAITKLSSADMKSEFVRIEKYLTEQGHISDVDLDELLCKDITIPTYMNNNNRTQLAKSLQRDEYRGRVSAGGTKFVRQRPGLQDIY